MSSSFSAISSITFTACISPDLQFLALYTSPYVPSSPTGENNRLFVTPGESIRKGNVTVDTATDVALADPSYTRTIGPRRSIDQLNKIVGESTKQEETPQDVKT